MPHYPPSCTQADQVSICIPLLLTCTSICQPDLLAGCFCYNVSVWLFLTFYSRLCLSACLIYLYSTISLSLPLYLSLFLFTSACVFYYNSACCAIYVPVA